MIISYILPFHIGFENRVVRQYPPSGDQLRDYLFFGETSSNIFYRYCYLERYDKEFQSIGQKVGSPNEAVSIDWTFAALKSYGSLDGATAVFALKTSEGQVPSLAIVSRTSVREISRLLNQMKRLRHGFKPRMLYTNEWPSASKFKMNAFGHDLIGRLGVFHAVKRITDTFQRVSDDFQ